VPRPLHGGPATSRRLWGPLQRLGNLQVRRLSWQVEIGPADVAEGDNDAEDRAAKVCAPLNAKDLLPFAEKLIKTQAKADQAHAKVLPMKPRRKVG